MHFRGLLSAATLLGAVVAQLDNLGGTDSSSSRAAATTSGSGGGSGLDGGDVCPSGGTVDMPYCCVGKLIPAKSTKSGGAAKTSSDSASSSGGGGGGGGGGGITATESIKQVGSAHMPIPVKSSGPALQIRAAPASGRGQKSTHTLPDGAVCVGTLISMGFSEDGTAKPTKTSSSSSVGALASLGQGASTTAAQTSSSPTSTPSSTSTGAAPGSFGEVRVAALLGAGAGVGIGMVLL